nr:PDZ domain-containing protein [Auraticoccus cholistanensis]
MDDSQTGAVVAALRAADVPVVERPQIASVTVGGPSEGALTPGDLVVAVQGREVSTREEVIEAVRAVSVGDEIHFTVLRDGEREQVVVTTVGSNTDAAVPVIGAQVGYGYEYPAEVSFGIDPRVGGSSAGLVFSLAIYDKITPGPLVTGHVAGTGTITADGEVGRIGGVQQKIRGAEQAGAQAFLLPTGNCRDLGEVDTDLQVVAVSSLEEAVAAVQALADPAAAEALPRCP